MNKTIISQLKRTLKKYGIRNADTIVNQTIKMNYEKFLDYADPVYVIDRIASCYEDQTAVKKLDDANREWLAIVIDKGWCKELDKYINEFGHKLTLAAIYYCIDNNTWQTWKGQLSLRSKNDDYWSGLAYISDAAFYLKDSGKFDPNAPELNGIFGKDNTTEEATTVPTALVAASVAADLHLGQLPCVHGSPEIGIGGLLILAAFHGAVDPAEDQHQHQSNDQRGPYAVFWLFAIGLFLIIGIITILVHHHASLGHSFATSYHIIPEEATKLFTIRGKFSVNVRSPAR